MKCEEGKIWHRLRFIYKNPKIIRSRISPGSKSRIKRNFWSENSESRFFSDQNHRITIFARIKIMKSQRFLIQYRRLQMTRSRDHKLWSWFFDPHRKINENENPKISGSQTKTIQKFKIKLNFHWKMTNSSFMSRLNLDRMRIILSYPKKHGRIKKHRGIIFFVPLRIIGSHEFAHMIKKKPEFRSQDHGKR